MRSVLTVIGAPGSRALDGGAIDAARAALAESGARAGAPRWLDPAHACDIPFQGAPREAVEAAVRDRLAGLAVDVATQDSEGRRKALLVADMESTIIGQELLDELADIAGIGARIAAITARSMAGEMDFAAALRARVRLLAGLREEALERVCARITLNPGARTLVRTMRAHGAYTALVTGGFTHFAERVRRACGFDEARGNRVVVADGALTGDVAEPILGRDSKRATLEELAARRGLPREAACAVGDGANDLSMIEGAGLGVAYRAKPVLRAAARFRVDHGDLTALLYLQGYRRAEFRG
ncbi:MAG: phosphoserine phosphatase SerB [Kiloniellaceae bacterium]